MLNQNTIKLINLKNPDIDDLFSICIGNTHIYQSRFNEYISKGKNELTANLNLNEGTFQIDDEVFNLQIIGKHNKQENTWTSVRKYSGTKEESKKLVNNVFKKFNEVGLKDYVQDEIMVKGKFQPYKLAAIIDAFSDDDQVLYVVNINKDAIYMSIDNAPEHIFKKISSYEFTKMLVEILRTYKVDHKLLIKSILMNNAIEYTSKQGKIIASFDNGNDVVMEFNKNNLLEKLQGKLSGEEAQKLQNVVGNTKKEETETDSQIEN